MDVNTNPNNTILKEQVRKAMRKAGNPVSAADIAKALNAELKKEGAIVSF